MFLPPPFSSTPSVSGGRLRNDQSGFDAVGPCPGFLQHMRPGNYESFLNQSLVAILFGAGSLMSNHYAHLDLSEHGRLSHCCILSKVWMPPCTCGRQEVLGSGEGSAMGRVERPWSYHSQQTLDKTLQRK